MKKGCDIECRDCGHEFVAIPAIPICRFCGGDIAVSTEFIATLNDGVDEDEMRRM